MQIQPLSRMAAVALSLASMLCSAQGRLSDKDVEALMRNLKDDAKSFRPVFNAAVSKSTIRKTSREKEAKNVAESFEKKTASLLEQFKSRKKVEGTVQDVVATGRQIEGYLVDLRLSGPVTNKWDRLHTELNQLAGTFGVAVGGQTGGAEVACLQGVGPERARKLVDECQAVSPATRPPCNAQNSCVMIIDEIKRGCKLLGQTAPIFCNEYTDSQPDTGTGRMISCYSDDGNRRTCDADTSGGVQLVRQREGAACRRDYSWGYDTRGIWVDHGCRADFRVR